MFQRKKYDKELLDKWMFFAKICTKDTQGTSAIEMQLQNKEAWKDLISKNKEYLVSENEKVKKLEKKAKKVKPQPTRQQLLDGYQAMSNPLASSTIFPKVAKKESEPKKIGSTEEIKAEDSEQQNGWNPMCNLF